MIAATCYFVTYYLTLKKSFSFPPSPNLLVRRHFHFWVFFVIIVLFLPYSVHGQYVRSCDFKVIKYCNHSAEGHDRGYFAL